MRRIEHRDGELQRGPAPVGVGHRQRVLALRLDDEPLRGKHLAPFAGRERPRSDVNGVGQRPLNLRLGRLCKVVRLQRQLVDAIAPPRTKHPGGLGDDGVLLRRRLHGQHGFAVDHARRSVGKVGLFGAADETPPVLAAEIAPHVPCGVFVAFDPDVRARPAIEGGPRGHAETRSELDHLVAGTDVQRVQHLARQLDPAGPQDPLAHSSQQPVAGHAAVRQVAAGGRNGRLLRHGPGSLPKPGRDFAGRGHLLKLSLSFRTNVA